MEKDKARAPLISVVMPVYNAGNYLKDAIKSICIQDFDDFELLIINDGSIDGAIDVVEHIKDSRIKVIHNPKNLGLIASLNVGLDHASGQIIARMDQDDLALPHRFSTQLKVLHDNPDIGVVGCWIHRFGADDQAVKYPIRDEEIKASMFFFNPISHPGVMFRKKLLDEHQIRYTPGYLDAEDYHLWFQLFHKTKFYNVPEVLLYYRIHPNQMGFVAPVASLASTRKIKKEALALFGVPWSSKEEEEWLNIVYQNPCFNEVTARVIDNLVRANRRKQVVNNQQFERKLLTVWKNSHVYPKKISSKQFRLFLRSPLLKEAKFTLRQYVSIFKKYIFNIL